MKPPTKIKLEWLRKTARAFYCKLYVKQNGAVHVLGNLSDLNHVQALTEQIYRVFPSKILECEINGVKQPGYPRIELHPQVIERKSALDAGASGC